MQTVLFHPTQVGIKRYASGLSAAIANAMRSAAIKRVTMAFGDCSPHPAFADQVISSVSEDLVAVGCERPTYRQFDANLGHGGGHNALFGAWNGEEYLLFLNPDTCADPAMLTEMLATMADATVGLVDARQLPLEHPKDYDRETGDTSWTSGACLLARSDVFAATGGFDADTFFLHGDDVDLSWRFRLAGWRVCHQRRARVFHDKRLDRDAFIVAGTAERRYGVLCHLLLATKYGRLDIAEETLDRLRADPDPVMQMVVDEFEDMRRRGAVPEPLPLAHDVALFVGDEFAPVRFHYGV